MIERSKIRNSKVRSIVIFLVMSSGFSTFTGPATKPVSQTPSPNTIVITNIQKPQQSFVISLIPRSISDPPMIPTPDHPVEPLSSFIYLDAIVWPDDPQVPILTYHRFIPDTYPNSTPTKTRLRDFKDNLQALYDSGYSLIPLEDWLDGDLSISPGRKPLIITMDDLFFADQIFLNPDGSPSLKSGLGVLWEFAKEHPDFGFHAALFYSFGDKYYGNKEVGDWWQVGPGWEDALAKAIVWCIEHGAIPYNHFYMHPRLDRLDSHDLVDLARKNEKTLREFLLRADRMDLVTGIGNIIALPYGLWPSSEDAQSALIKYVSVNGQPLKAILEIDGARRAKYLQPFYSENFDHFHVPRIVANTAGIELLTAPESPIKAASECRLGPVDLAGLADEDYLHEVIRTASDAGCPDGIYLVEGRHFRLADGQVTTIAKIQPPENTNPDQIIQR